MGSEDSHGRTLWALGACAANSRDPLAKLGQESFSESVPSAENFTSPRSWAFCLLGIDHYAAANTLAPPADRLRRVLVERLMSLLSSNGDKEWHWFEDVLAYDNARLPQALLMTGRTTGDRDCTEAGLRSLRWLTTLQTSPAGCFRPIGSDSFGCKRALPQLFDQQPLEAAATISASLAAWRADGDSTWRTVAETASSGFWVVMIWEFPWSMLQQEAVVTGSSRSGERKPGSQVRPLLPAQRRRAPNHIATRRLSRTKDDQRVERLIPYPRKEREPCPIPHS